MAFLLDIPYVEIVYLLPQKTTTKIRIDEIITL